MDLRISTQREGEGHFCAIGDVIMVSALIPALRAAYPEASATHALQMRAGENLLSTLLFTHNSHIVALVTGIHQHQPGND
jgi:hypothetical protein